MINPLNSLCALTALLLAMPAEAQFLSRNIVVGGVARQYSYYLPAGYNGATPQPLMLAFHGGCDNSQGFSFVANFRPMADADGFIAVYPQGLALPSDPGCPVWNSVGPYSSGVDDISYTEAVIDDLIATYNVDQSRVYACGYSNGANICWELACYLSDRIAAIGPVAGSMWEWTQTSCTPTRAVPVVSIHGTQDSYNAYNGGPPYSLGLIAASQYWAQNANANTNPTTVALPNTAPGDGSTVDLLTWSDGDDCVSIDHYRVNNGGHDWPGSFGNMDIDSTEVIWEFCRRFDLNGEIGCSNASFASVGNGCPTSAMIPVGSCQSVNPLGGTLLNSVSPDDYAYRVGNNGPTSVLSFDIYTQSTSGQITVPAYIYASAGAVPSINPIATTSITIGPTAGFYTATFATPVAVNGTYFVAIDSTNQNIVLSDMLSGTFNLSYTRPANGGSWSFQLMRPSWNVRCTSQPLYPTPALDTDALPQLGSTYNLTLDDGVPSSFGILVSGLSSTGANGVPLPGAPGCDLYATPTALNLVAISASGTASSPITIPNLPALDGLVAYHQWAILDIAANQLGIVTSNAGMATIGL